MCTRVPWYCLLVYLLTVSPSFQQDGTQSSDSTGIDELENCLEQRLTDSLEKRMSILHKENMIPIHNRLNTIEENVAIIRDDFSKFEKLFLQKIKDQQDNFSEHINGSFIKLEEDLDNTSALLHKVQCTEGCTWRENCNGCLCLNGQHVCSNKGCSNDTNIFTNTALNTAINGSVLFKAAEQGNMTMVNKALASGTDIHWRNWYGSTALHAAAATNQHAVAEVLMAAGADPHGQDGDGETPLYRACCRNTLVMGTLIAHGADVNIPNNFNRTPLHSAAFQNYLDTVLINLRAGANTQAQDMMGSTPSDSARLGGHNDLASMIDNYSNPVTAG